jgi:hypothetical protein
MAGLNRKQSSHPLHRFRYSLRHITDLEEKCWRADNSMSSPNVASHTVPDLMRAAGNFQRYENQWQMLIQTRETFRAPNDIRIAKRKRSEMFSGPPCPVRVAGRPYMPRWGT